MSTPSSANSSPSASTGPEEVLKLSCPVCSAGLNLRRKHIGIEGKCVQCKTPVTAREVDGTVALVASHQASDPAEEEAVAPPSPSTALHQQAPAFNTSQSSPEPGTTGAGTPDAKAGSSSESGENASAEDATVSASLPESFSPPAKAPDSPWGFPGRDEEAPEAALPSPVSEMEASIPETNNSPAAPTEFANETSFGKPHSGAHSESIPGEPNVGTSSDPLAETGKAASSPFSSSEGGSMFDSAPFPDPNLQPASAQLQPESEESKPKEMEEKIPSAFDAPLDQGPETVHSSESASFSLEKEDPMTKAGSALFGGANEADDSDSGSGEINTSWGAKVPSPGHASISPFNDAAPSSGFADSLFREKAEEQSAGAPIEPKSPFGNSDDGAMTGGALFSGPTSSPNPSPAVQPSPQEEVVLDGDGRPMKPMTDEEKDAFAKEMMQVGDYHKRSPWVVRIVKFLITMVVLGGLGYAGYIFMPDEKIKELQQKTLEFLEPGSVLLDFLPVEIIENENGEKEMKVKAVESLNEFSTEMDAYLDASEQNLKESGAIIPEREKAEKMEGPDIPKLPFDLPGMKGKLPSAETGEAEKE